MNTYDYRHLLRMYEDQTGQIWPHKMALIKKLWAKTARNSARGARIPRDVLDARAAETIQLMIEAAQ